MNTLTPRSKVGLARRALPRVTAAIFHVDRNVKGEGGKAVVKPDEYRKARLVAERLGLCSKTIARWGNQGLITRYKINPRVVLYSVAEVDAFVQAARV